MREKIAELFQETFLGAPESLTRVAADGSQRTYFRLTGGPRESVIGAHGPDPDENRAFLSFSRTFRELGLPVPEIYAVDEDRGLWLAEDLGDTTLFEALDRSREPGEGGIPDPILSAYERVVEILPRFQVEGAREIDFGLAYPRSAFDSQSMRWDLNYFKYHFLKLSHVPFHEQRLEDDFDRLTGFLLQADAGYFLYRDFQSRNIMLRGGEPWFIDYQGGRRGALPYDLASLLYDAKARLPGELRERLIERYLDALGEHVAVDRDRFRTLLRGFVLIRIMQAMGAYGYRGFFERKPRFLESVPHAARNIAGLLEEGLPLPLPEVEEVFGRIVERWVDEGAPGTEAGLTVHIASFSYRHGYPADDRGHGGGFVFDCRSLPNPGRRPELVAATGLDARVVEVLETSREVEAFWEEVKPLVERHVESFRKRGFTDLSVSFGCTGGQHRSVYFAERLAGHLKERFSDVDTTVRHRERSAWPAPEPAGDEATDGPEGTASERSWTP